MNHVGYPKDNYYIELPVHATSNQTYNVNIVDKHGNNVCGMYSIADDGLTLRSIAEALCERINREWETIPTLDDVSSLRLRVDGIDYSVDIEQLIRDLLMLKSAWFQQAHRRVDSQSSVKDLMEGMARALSMTMNDSITEIVD